MKSRVLLHVQLARAFAATLVVVDHALGGLRAVGVNLPFAVTTGKAGNFAVHAFFVMSGVIMVLSSRSTGSWRDSGEFAWRRLSRIAPMYWVGTLIMFGLYRVGKLPVPHPVGQMLLSLFFLPNYLATDSFPILNHGWTLDFEMFFYVLFGLALALPRKLAFVAVLVVTTLVGTVGTASALKGHAGPIAGFYLVPIVLMFTAGVAIGWLLDAFPNWRIPIPFSPSYIVLGYGAYLFLPGSGNASQAAVSVWGVVVVGLCALAKPEPTGWERARLVPLGDASYSTYIFHEFAVIVMLEVVRSLHTPSWYAIAGMTALALALAWVLGVLMYRNVEVPLLGLLRGRLRASKKEPLSAPA